MRLILTLSVFCLFLIGCRKDRNPCPDSKTYTYNIEFDTKAKVPYTGVESLVFISNTGDTSKLKGQGKSEYYKEFSYMSSMNPDCSMIIDYWRDELNDYTFNGTSSGIDKIVFSTIGGLISGGPQSPGGGTYSGQDIDYDGFQISCNGSTILNFSVQPKYANDTTQYTESIVVNGNIIFGRSIGSGLMLFNYKYGIIQFTDTIQNKTWTINF